MPQNEYKAQKFDLIYSQSGYLYMVLPDAPHPLPFNQENLDASHSADGLIGAITQFNPYGKHIHVYGNN
jgi:hypothetical protein